MTKVSQETIRQLSSAAGRTKHESDIQVYIFGGICPTTTPIEAEAMFVLAILKVKCYSWNVIEVTPFNLFQHACRFGMRSLVEEWLLRPTCKS